MTADDSATPSETPLRYLSDAWIEAADAAVADLPPVATEVAVAMEVTGGPNGDRNSRRTLGPDRVGVSGDAEGAGVSMRLSWALATEIAQGRSSAQRAFLDGEIQLGGDTSLLLGHQEELARLDDRLAPLRSRTDFG